MIIENEEATSVIYSSNAHDWSFADLSSVGLLKNWSRLVLDSIVSTGIIITTILVIFR